MTHTENTAVALAQSAYQQAVRKIEASPARRRELARIGLLGLLACELDVELDEAETISTKPLTQGQAPMFQTINEMSK